MEIITVLTPTYNRADKLVDLYLSLVNQKQKLKWLIVDDGSTDNTYEIIQKLKTESPFRIDYYKKTNGGKHTALNLGIANIDTELTIIVDSDDKLLDGAIESIEQIYKKYNNNKKIAAYSFLKILSNGQTTLGLEKNEFEANYIEYRIKGNHPGDMAEVFVTKALKDNLFPVFEGEKFLSEDVVWMEIGKEYNFVFVNQPIYECEYLDNGLTANDKRMKFASPLGSMLRGKKLMDKRCGVIANIKGAIIYNCYKIKTDNKLLYTENLKEKLLVFLTIPLGRLYRFLWKRRIVK